MKKTITVLKEVDLKTLHVEAGVRYWEDSTVNDQEETEDDPKIPFKEGELWKPVIDLETGYITNWPKGTKASVHYKVCDAGSYYIKDAEGNTVLSIVNDCVPSILCPSDNGYGDYIIMEINQDGKIANWEADLSDFLDADD